MFSLHFALKEEQSRVWFGGYDRSVIVAQALRDDPDGGYETMTDAQLDDQIAWFSLAYRAYWSTPLKKVTLGGVDLDVQVEHLIFDSGSSLNHVPVADFNRIVELITEGGADCTPHMRPLTTYYCACDSVEDPSFPIIQIHTTSKVFNFKPRDYLIYEYVPE